MSPGAGVTPRLPQRGAFEAAGKVPRCARDDNVVVGFAPLKPAEFVIITIRQLVEKKKP